MKDFEFYKTIRLSTNKKLQKAFEKLRNIYSTMPETKGCLENIDREGECGAWCCKVQTPQLLYSEFLFIWRFISNNWTDDEICDLFERCMLNAVDEIPSKGCVFFNSKTNLCTVHAVRPYNCFLPDTWVYTSKGPQKIKDILAGDFVYGRDGKLHKVIMTATQVYDGKIYNIRYQGNDIDAWCTEDHEWLLDERKDKRKKVNLSWVKTKNIISKKNKQYGNYLSLPNCYDTIKSGIKTINVLDFIKALRDGDKLSPFTSNDVSKLIPAKIDVDDEFLFMLGIYLAEGSASDFSVSFSMHLDERCHLERIEKYFNSLGVRCTYPKVSHSKKLLVLRVGSSLIGRLLSSLGGSGAKNKSINDDLFSMIDSSQMKKIYDAWDIGDGRKGIENEFSTVTISEKLAVQMNFILFSNGIFSRIYRNHNKNRGHSYYDVHVFPSSLGFDVKKGQGTKIISNDEYILAPVRDIDTRYYRGPVVDLQVEDSETFITSSGIAHNCRVYGITPRKEFDPRYEQLKKEYKEIVGAVIKPQCDLVSTVDGSEVTVSDTDAWWNELAGVERLIGIPMKFVTDKMGGSYRTSHDHVLLYNMPENVLNSLAGIKMYEDYSEKIRTVSEIVSHIRNYFKGVSR